MERKVTVLIESTQSKYDFATSASTLGELKSEMTDKGIAFDFDNVFKESRSRTILTTDASVLPSNLPWKGGVTNDLVFLVTAPKIKIASGASSRRAEAYRRIKELMLESTVKIRTGGNFTRVSTDTLEALIKEAEEKAAQNNQRKGNSGAEVPAMDNLKNFLAILEDDLVIDSSVSEAIIKAAEGVPASDIGWEAEDSYESLVKDFNF